MSKAGDRVGALREMKDGKAYLYGYGTYAGDFIPPNFPYPNPRIDLDNGKTVWGFECWWGPEAKVAVTISGKEVIVADIEEDRLEAENAVELGL